MTDTEVQLLRAKLLSMSDAELEEFCCVEDRMNAAYDEGYYRGRGECSEDYSNGFDDGYAEGLENGANEK